MTRLLGLSLQLVKEMIHSVILKCGLYTESDLDIAVRESFDQGSVHGAATERRKAPQ